MAASTPIPDLVKLSKLVTQFSNERRRISQQERWIRKWKLGRGGFGIVWLEQCIQGDKQNELRAVKEVPKNGSENYYRELEAMALFSHENYDHCFVKSFGWYEDNMDIFIAMEFFPEGDLGKYLGSPLPEQEAQDIAAQVLEGLQFMHSHNFAHRDLKPDNILVACKGPNWWVKIADFGISKRAAQGVTALRTLIGTPAFAAPEVLQYIEVNGELDQSYNHTVDIWSLSVILFLVLTGESLFQAPSRLIRYITGGFPFPADQLLANHVSDNGCDFLRKTMQPRPESRPRADECRQHLWVQRDLQATKSSRPLDMTALSPEPTNLVDYQPSGSWSTQDQTSSPDINALNPKIFGRPRSGISLGKSTLSFDTSNSKPVKDANSGSYTSVQVEPESATYQKRSSKLLVKYRPGQYVSMAFSPTSEELAFGTNVRDTVVLSSTTSELRANMLGLSSKQSKIRGMVALTYSPDGKQLAFGLRYNCFQDESEGEIQLWDAGFMQRPTTFSVGKLSGARDFVFSPDGKYIAFLASRITIQISDVSKKASPKLLHSRVYPTSYSRDLSFSPNGEQLASISINAESRAIVLWDLPILKSTQDMEASFYLEPSLGEAIAIAYSPDGERLFSAANTGIEVWYLKTRACLKQIMWPEYSMSNGFRFGACVLANNPHWRASFSPDGQRCFILTSKYDDDDDPHKGSLLVLETNTGKVVQDIDAYYVENFVISPNGKKLALLKDLRWVHGREDEIEIWAQVR